MPMNVILLERVPKLGQMGDVVKVKPGFARNYLLPQKKALRATKENVTYFESQRKTLEAQNLERRKDAEAVATKLSDFKVTLVRQASEALQLYGHGVSPGVQIGNSVDTVRATHDRAGGAGLFVRGGDRRSWNRSLTRVGHNAGDSAEAFLRGGRTSENDRQQGHHDADSETQSHVDYSFDKAHAQRSILRMESRSSCDM